jgi:hypothetical protein
MMAVAFMFLFAAMIANGFSHFLAIGLLISAVVPMLVIR